MTFGIPQSTSDPSSSLSPPFPVTLLKTDSALDEARLLFDLYNATGTSNIVFMTLFIVAFLCSLVVIVTHRKRSFGKRYALLPEIFTSIACFAYAGRHGLIGFAYHYQSFPQGLITTEALLYIFGNSFLVLALLGATYDNIDIIRKAVLFIFTVFGIVLVAVTPSVSPTTGLKMNIAYDVCLILVFLLVLPKPKGISYRMRGRPSKFAEQALKLLPIFLAFSSLIILSFDVVLLFKQEYLTLGSFFVALKLTLGELIIEGVTTFIAVSLIMYASVLETAAEVTDSESRGMKRSEFFKLTERTM